MNIIEAMAAYKEGKKVRAGSWRHGFYLMKDSEGLEYLHHPSGVLQHIIEPITFDIDEIESDWGVVP